MKFRTLIVSTLAALLASTGHTDADDAERERYFESQVRPLLIKRCFECHGETKQQAGLRLDSRAAMLRGIDGDPAIKPGSPDESRILQVIAYSDDDSQMPPDGKLPAEEIVILTKWIAEGAVWPGSEEGAQRLGSFPLTPDGEIDFAAAAGAHWAYQPIVKTTPPSVPSTELVRSPIDRFLLAKLEEAGLSYSPEADRWTLIRRAYFDLIGLPPTYNEVQAFIADDSPNAYEQLIDRLLASPLYGQRWARHWLDIARYADTKGYVFTQNPKYPFAYTYRDYVVRALNEDKPFDRFVIEQLAADRLGLPKDDPTLAALGYLTVGRQFLGNNHDRIDDQIDVVTRGLMGMTVSCARCHDHKYDPIPTADYYSLYGVFNSSTEPGDLPIIGQPDDSPEYRAYTEELAKREQAVEDYRTTTHQELLQQAREHVADYLLAVVQLAKKVPPGVEVTFQQDKRRDNLTKLWALTIAQRVKDNDPVFLPWGALAALPVEGFADQAAALIEKYSTAAEGESPPVNAKVWAALQESPPQSMVDVARLYGRLLTEVDNQWRTLVEQSGDTPPQRLPDEADEQLRRILTGPGSITSLPVDDRLFERDHRDKLTELRRKVNEWHSESPGAPPRAMVMVDKENPVQPVVFLRGTAGRNGPKVPRRFPRVLGGAETPEFSEGSGRLELAQAIVSPDNPLTARVIVSRVWRHHFGSPLVSTPSDFGTRADPPTHPELLDWLAASFIEQGWSLKWLHREIMTSTAYQQSSADRPNARRADPENRLLWRMNRQRLEFEPMRDAMLAVAGRLDPSIGGRPVDIETTPDTGRRSIYAFIDRNNFSPLLRTFDYPSPDVHSAGRPLTAVPQQTLYAMNAPFPRQMAHHIAERAEVRDALTPQERVAALYRIILARDPQQDELALATEFLTTAQNTQQLAQALMLTNEFLFVD